jgi:hypothetical protein
VCGGGGVSKWLILQLNFLKLDRASGKPLDLNQVFPDGDRSGILGIGYGRFQLQVASYELQVAGYFHSFSTYSMNLYVFLPNFL